MTDDDTVDITIPDELYLRFLVAKVEYDRCKEELDEADGAIRAFLQQANKGYSTVVHAQGRHVGSYTRVDSLRLDSSKLRAEQPSIYDAYVKPSTSWRLAWLRNDGSEKPSAE